jgi:hypothetical protein
MWKTITLILILGVISEIGLFYFIFSTHKIGLYIGMIGSLTLLVFSLFSQFLNRK